MSEDGGPSPAPLGIGYHTTPPTPCCRIILLTALNSRGRRLSHQKMRQTYIMCPQTGSAIRQTLNMKCCLIIMTLIESHITSCRGTSPIKDLIISCWLPRSVLHARKAASSYSNAMEKINVPVAGIVMLKKYFNQNLYHFLFTIITGPTKAPLFVQVLKLCQTAHLVFGAADPLQIQSQ